MIFLVIPQIGISEGSVKDIVIAILCDKWPLTPKSIYNIMKRQYAICVSYQAVHKVIKQLVEKGVLIREDRSYLLNIEWIQRVRKFGEELECVYRNSHGSKIDGTCTQTIKFCIDNKSLLNCF